MLCQTSNHLLGIKNTLLSHQIGICTFMRCGNLTYDTWIWLKVTFMFKHPVTKIPFGNGIFCHFKFLPL